MRAITINEAEYILEPFWDGGTSDFTDTDPRYHVLDEYTLRTTPGALARIAQAWAFAEFTVERGIADAPVLVMERACENIEAPGCDTFLLFGSIPQTAQIRVTGVQGGQEAELLALTQGCGATQEYEGKWGEGALTHLRIEIYCVENATGNIGWLGAADSAGVARMLARNSVYTAQWPGCFTPDFAANASGSFSHKSAANTAAAHLAPDMSLLFGAEDLPALREKLRTEPFLTVMNEKRQQAHDHMAIAPETYIGRYVPLFDRRWCRTRDGLKNGAQDGLKMYNVMENLAFVGIIDGDAAMLRMACRHLLAVCHCEHWCESIMGVFPGATWHHRSFTESFFAKAAALVLDWAGGLLTPHAKQLVRDALALKALPRLESDFRRVEYIRHMNQGIVFSVGRIFALLALLPRHPRYASCLAEAESDLVEMIGNYVQADGGTLEGPAYWMFTFRDIMSAFYALARGQGKPFADYKVLFAKTGAFALGLLSMEEEGTLVLSINDAHPGSPMSCSLASSFYLFTQDARWRRLYETLLRRSRIDEDAFALISVPAASEANDSRAQDCAPPPALFCTTGQLGSVRDSKIDDLRTHVHYCSGLAYRGHYHQDKGSIILEADGAALCPDFGTGFYHEADLFQLTNPAAHSLLLPVYADGRTVHQHAFAPCGTILRARADETSLDFCADETVAWEGAPYAQITRRVFSPFASLVVLVDTYTLEEASSATFVLNGSAPYAIDGATATLRGETGVRLRVQPLNWQWEHATCAPCLDGERHPVYQLLAEAGGARSGTLITALCLEKTQPVAISETPDGWRFAQGGNTVTLTRAELTVPIANGHPGSKHTPPEDC